MQSGRESSWRQLVRLAWRNLLRNPSRAGLTMLAIVAGVSSLILATGFVEDMFDQLGESLIRSQSGHIQIGKIGFATVGSRSPERYFIESVDGVRNAVRGIDGVSEVMARVRFAGLLNNGKADLPIVAEGIEPDAEARLGTAMHVVSGRALDAQDQFGIVLGQGVASAMGLEPGDQVGLLVSTGEGALNVLDFEVVGTFRTFSKEFDARVVRVTLSAAQELLTTDGVNSLVVLLSDTARTPAVSAILRQSLANRGLEVKTWVELNDFYEKTVALYRRQLGVLEFIILVMVSLGVVNLVNMAVMERLGEFGTMRALGNGNRDVFMLVVLENAMLAFAGGLAGVALGCTGAWLVSRIGIPMPPPPNADVGYTAKILVTWSVIGKAFVVGFCAPVVASLAPAWRVSRMPIAEQLRRAI